MINNPDYFKNTFRIPSTRSLNWDYAGSGTYFVTICTKNKEKWFGEIEKDQVQLSKIGKVIEEEWVKTPTIRPYVSLDQYVIMPNHFHGIITLDMFDFQTVQQSATVETQSIASLPSGNAFGPQSHNLASVIRGFKAACTNTIRQFEPTFSWQPRFHDKIIRNEKQLSGIRRYIISNPYNWKTDENYM